MNQRPHILQIAPTPFFADRGCHIRIAGIVRCLTELGYDNTVCTYHHGRDVPGVTTTRIATIQSYTQTEAGPNKYKLLADWKLLWLALGQYRKLRPVAIHAHLHEGLLIGLLLKTLFFWRRTPLIADMQGSLTGELDSHGAFGKFPFLRWPTKLLERTLMWCATHIVCSSRHSLDKIRREFNISSDKISLAQDGADPVEPPGDQQRAELYQKLSLPDDKIIVVYSGALLETKGLNELKTLIAGCRQVANLHFLVIGYPTENLIPFLEKEGLEPRCTVTGRVGFEELPQYLCLADIAIDPKCSDAGEGSGKILNYIACGLPVVAFDTQNNRDFLPKEMPLAQTGDEMQSQLKALAKDAEARMLATQHNLVHFSNHYSWTVTQTQLKEVYSRFTAKRAKVPYY